MQNILTDKNFSIQSIAKYSTPSAKSLKKRRVFLCFAGALIGIVNGLFGAGGGMLTVPALTFIAGLDERHSHASAIAVILPLCAVSTAVYSFNMSFEWNVILPTVLGVSIGGVVGAKLLKKLSGNVLSFIFYGIMLFAGLKMIF